MNTIFRYLLFVILIVLLNQCKTTFDKAIVQTDSVSIVTHSTALVYCQVIDPGSFSISQSGVVWNISPNLSTEDSLLFTGSEQEAYLVPLTGLEPNTTYFTRACVGNSVGISYGEEINFKTKAVTTFTDTRDNNIYTEITIGNQIWMGENLKYIASGESFPVENEFLSDLSDFGRLYSFEVSDEVCPLGWRLPKDDDWKTMERYLGMSEQDIQGVSFRGNVGGKKLKQPGTKFWESSDVDVTNESGFTALPAGVADINGTNTSVKYSSYFWTSPDSEEKTWVRYLSGSEGGIGRASNINDSYCSVRCIKE
jgi:uncharacterized protein (TIGR02145 family)